MDTTEHRADAAAGRPGCSTCSCGTGVPVDGDAAVAGGRPDHLGVTTSGTSPATSRSTTSSVGVAASMDVVSRSSRSPSIA